MLRTLNALAIVISPAAAAADRTADELAILRVPTLIERAVDAKDWDEARRHFTDEITVDFTSLAGGEPATIPADALIEGWSANLGPQKASHHMRGHGLVTFTGADAATVQSSGYAWNRMEGNGDPLWEVWGDYTHELIRTEGGWKVKAMTFDAVHQRGNEWVRDTPSPAK